MQNRTQQNQQNKKNQKRLFFFNETQYQNNIQPSHSIKSFQFWSSTSKISYQLNLSTSPTHCGTVLKPLIFLIDSPDS